MIDIKLGNEEKCLILLYLNDIPGIGPGRIKMLYDQFKNLKAILYYIENNNINAKWFKNLKIFLDKMTLNSLDKYKRIIDATYQCGGKMCTLDDNIYPTNLKKSSMAPSVLFYKGSLDDISEKSLAIVGTVDPSENGVKRAKKFARLCVENDIQVISGLARGIDTIAQTTALKYGGKTYSVVAYGIDYCYPPENKKLFDIITENGAVISQFATGTKPMRWMFPARNETMCTLSLGTVIIEAHEKCGSLIQARYSFKHQRRVFLLHSNLEKGEIWSSKLIEEGALPVMDFKEDILKHMSDVNKSFKESSEKENFGVIDNINNKKAFLFDLDGVLYDSIKIIKHVYALVVKKINGSICSNDIDIISKRFNNAPTYVFKALNIDPKRGNELYRKVYFDYIKKGIDFFPDVDRVISELKKQKYVIGIVTSQPLSRYKIIMQNAKFKDDISVAVTWNDIPRGKTKPDPCSIFKALETIAVLPQNAVYIGDDPKDVLAARNAGTASIAALWGASDPQMLIACKADYNAKVPNDILSYSLGK